MTEKKFNPRELMELAVEQMHLSVQESRTDGKASPLVGAVIYKEDGTIETAYRGELREGDHAEYTLLERKNKSEKLDNAILFSTLEPCAPGARKHPKVDCAERILLARIREVWIGIEDPDPKVDRKGIKHLEKNGVRVHMFERDLQSQIQLVNKEFIEQAQERAKSVPKEVKPVKLSKLEDAIPNLHVKDFSQEAIQKYKEITGLDSIAESDFNNLLNQQGILKEVNGDLKPTGYGIVLFGKNPRLVMPQVGLLGTMYFQNGNKEIEDFDGPLVLVPEKLEVWLRKVLPNIITKEQMYRQESLNPLIELIREATINALVHRDYDIESGKCHIVINSNTITITSPGKPLPQISLERLQSFSAPTLSRNPLLHYIFSKMKLAEERGLGMHTLKTLPKTLGIPKPSFEYDSPNLVLKIFRSTDSVIIEESPELLELLSDEEKKGFAFISLNEAISSSEYAEHLKIDNRKAQRQLKKLVENGLVEKSGSGRATRYELKTKPEN